MLSIKKTSDNIKDETWFSVYGKVVTEGFKRGYNHKIAHVKKRENHNYA